jgi:hypothetical protein
MFQIMWGATSVSYYVDGALVAVHNMVVAVPMSVYLSNNGNSSAQLTVNWVRVDSYPQTSGTYVSCVKDAGTTTAPGQLISSGPVASGTSLAFATQSSLDGNTWSAWSPVRHGQITSPPGRYRRYRVVLNGTAQASPEFDSVSLIVQISAPSPTMTPTASAF